MDNDPLRITSCFGPTIIRITSRNDNKNENENDNENENKTIAQKFYEQLKYS